METRRLNINLPKEVANQLEDLSKRSGRSMTEIVRTGLGLAAVAYEETRKDNRLAITDSKGQPIKELILPR